MAGKDLRKLSKTELLELLVEQGRENLALKQRLEAAEAELARQRVQIAECGSIAEAAMRLSGVFEAAQKAADLYVENCRRQCDEAMETPQREVRRRRASSGGEAPEA